MTVKQKFKPAARSDIREKVELKFRARGAVVFHLLLVLIGAVLLLYNFFDLWASRFFDPAYLNSILAFGVLAASGAFHFIRYHFRHGRGRDNHETETESLIAQRLQRAAPEDAGEQEVLIRLQQDDKLKNRRLVWQHLTLFAGISSLLLLLPLSDMTVREMLDWSNWQPQATYVGVWGIGLAAHILRYLFAYRVSSRRREAKIEEQLLRELRRERRQHPASAREASADLVAEASGRERLDAADNHDQVSIEDLLQAQSASQRANRH